MNDLLQRLLCMAMTDATGGGRGGDNPGGVDANDETDAMSGGDATSEDGDIPGVADEPDTEYDDPDADSDATPSDTPDQPYPGYVPDEVVAAPGQIDENEIDNQRMGEASMRDLGIDPKLREEMLDNAVAYGLDVSPTNVNDERAFDDGLPGSWSDFSAVTEDAPEGTTRLADPNDDAGGDVKGPRVGGAGGFDGGPPRATPLPDSDDE